MNNEVALITGASRGIGKGIAIAMAREGWNVVINFRGAKKAAEETKAECLQAARQSGHQIEAVEVQADISCPTDRKRILESVRERFGRLDILINNAGIAPKERADLLEASEESFDLLMQVNVKGPYFLTQACAKWMQDQKKSDPTRSPKIVTISSISAYTASVNRGDYCMSKAALSMLTPLFASRLAEDGIGVFEIRPGVIATDMTAGVKEKYDHLIESGLTPMPRWGTPDDVARTVLAICKDSFPFSVGEVINVDGGFHLRRL